MFKITHQDTELSNNITFRCVELLGENLVREIFDQHPTEEAINVLVSLVEEQQR